MSTYEEVKEVNAKIDALIKALGFEIEKEVIQKSASPSWEGFGAVDYWEETEYTITKRDD